MIKEFENLNHSEKEILLKATTLVSLYAACLDGKFDEQENAEAIRLAHLRTYSSPPMLRAYYKEIEPKFLGYYSEWLEKLPADNKEKINYLHEQISILNEIFSKLEQNYSVLLRKSLISYAVQVSNSKKNFLEAFLIPFDIPGITETIVKSFNQNI